MAGIPVAFSDIAKPANDVGRFSTLAMLVLTRQQLLTKDFYHVQAGISSGTRSLCWPF